MKHQFEGKSFGALYGLAFSGIAIGLSYIFINRDFRDWDSSWRGGVYILISVVALAIIRRCQTYGESISIDSSGIELNFFLLRRTILMSEVEAIYHLTKDKERFVIKLINGETILIPLRAGMNRFIFDAQRQHNFPLVKFETGNLDHV